MNAIGLRKAAATLAALHRDDRAWILARLPSAARVDIRPLLTQIRALGGPDENLIGEALEVCAKQDLAPEPPAPNHLLVGMRGMTPQWKARVLVACAPDHVGLYAASNAASDVRAVRAELLALPKQLPPKLASALTAIVRRRGEGANEPLHSMGND